MNIGYLHLGPPGHGVNRYGKVLAAEAKQRTGVEVLEISVLLTGDLDNKRRLLDQAAQELSKADIVHLQFSKFAYELWGEEESQMVCLNHFFNQCLAPVVVTLHDVYYTPMGIKKIMGYLGQKLVRPRTDKITKTTQAAAVKPASKREGDLSKQTKPIPNRILNIIRKFLRGVYGKDALILKTIEKRASCLFVCTYEELKRLEGRVRRTKIHYIPHFVESRHIDDINPAIARKELGLDSTKNITVLGFIYPAKGHRLVIDAMAMLPEDTMIIFAGGASDDHKDYLEELREQSRLKGVSHRLRITGYLTEEELEKYLVSTDVAVWPPAVSSASGSLSTWISVAQPVIAANLPQVQELQDIEVDAIETFSPYRADTLAMAIKRRLNEQQPVSRLAVERLQQKLSISNAFDRHLEKYQSIIAHDD